MTIIKNRMLAAFLIIITLTMCGSIVASADTQQKLDETNDALEQLRQLQSQQSSELSDMNTQMNSINNELSSLQSQIEDKQTEIEKLDAESDALEEDIAKQYESMKLRIKYMYENGTENALDILLSSESFGDLLSKSEYVYQLTKYDNNMMASLNDDLARLTSNRETVQADMDSLTELRSSASTQSQNLKSVILDMQNKIDVNSDNIAELEAAAKRYEAQLEAERIAALAAKGSGKSSSYVNGGGKPIAYSQEDLDMLAAIIECEAGNQSYEGKLAVASVVCNRVNDSRFDSTVSVVILSPKQFSPVASGRFAIVLARGATSECYKAAKQALEGNINVDAIYFIAYRGAQDDDKLKIGDHVFFSDWSLY